VSTDRFFDRINTEYVFERDGNGRVTGFTFRLSGGRTARVERVE
jgi:hypothetical protein